ncbi:hypothetical protein NMY22_g13926 [Coprinellus aureogranulatus]|nr:hypothetical protein NMY22_g13926 [Coprinellus aureogranulatus]
MPSTTTTSDSCLDLADLLNIHRRFQLSICIWLSNCAGMGTTYYGKASKCQSPREETGDSPNHHPIEELPKNSGAPFFLD